MLLIAAMCYILGKQSSMFIDIFLWPKVTTRGLHAVMYGDNVQAQIELRVESLKITSQVNVTFRAIRINGFTTASCANDFT